MERFRKILEQFKLPLALSLAGLVLIIGGLVSGQASTREDAFPKESLISSRSIILDISGAVNKPGVYKLDHNSRIEDAIKAAGGIRENANSEYVSKYLNMAQKLSDGMKIYIPFVDEQGIVSAVKSVGGISSGLSGQVSINSASQSELEALPGIGPVTASKIISGRPYGKPEDLLNQKIVSKSTWEKIKDSVVY